MRSLWRSTSLARSVPSSHRWFPSPSAVPSITPTYVSAHSFRCRLRYAYVTMSRHSSSSSALRPTPSGSPVCSTPAAGSLVRLLPRAASFASTVTFGLHLRNRRGAPCQRLAVTPAALACDGGASAGYVLGYARGTFSGSPSPGLATVRARPNPSIQGTVEKLRFSIPSALRASAAPDLERSASCNLSRYGLR
jgi:hypothetical protein